MASDFLGKTAYYDPNTQTIVLYTEGRHPKDIARSFSHEMIHHIQNIEDRLGDIQTTNTNKDKNLDAIEREAYQEGNMIFRNWTDSLDGDVTSSIAENKDYFEIEQFIVTLLENDIPYSKAIKVASTIYKVNKSQIYKKYIKLAKKLDKD